ncbi:deoxyguanosinetriphosphate triphosphohydrolase-like protein [Planctomycetales bacterium]|nr:deoxyguanosinetriphosphate triphosphohydrolase-like protein [Planctomycetales bacterium]
MPLAPYAMRDELSRGRRHAEPEHQYRAPYQRDRDRVIHCSAFRRLEYKTQVFANDGGDFYRTRLTHTLEVMQIARSIARALAVNEDLTEALAMAHDVGHSPFGHTGERVLNEFLSAQGGFNHNAHGLRVVDFLEERYPDFCGLNLTFETREGFFRHLPPTLKSPEFAEFSAAGNGLLEQQIVEVADGVAYNNHDLDDGLYSGVINEADLMSVELWRVARAAARTAGESPKMRRIVTVRRLIDRLTDDVITTTRENLRRLNIDSVEAVRACAEPLVTPSPPMQAQTREMKKFLQENFYASPTVEAMMAKAKLFLRALLTTYRDDERLLPKKYRAADPAARDRRIADYLAGMTDRFVEKEYAKLFLVR